MRSFNNESLSPRYTIKERSNSLASLKMKSEREDIETQFPLPLLVKLESALYNSNLDRVSREYSGRLKSVANIILSKLNQ